MIIWDTFRTL